MILLYSFSSFQAIFSCLLFSSVRVFSFSFFYSLFQFQTPSYSPHLPGNDLPSTHLIFFTLSSPRPSRHLPVDLCLPDPLFTAYLPDDPFLPHTFPFQSDPIPLFHLPSRRHLSYHTRLSPPPSKPWWLLVPPNFYHEPDFFNKEAVFFFFLGHSLEESVASKLPASLSS